MVVLELVRSVFRGVDKSTRGQWRNRSVHSTIVDFQKTGGVFFLVVVGVEIPPSVCGFTIPFEFARTMFIAISPTFHKS